VLPIFVVLAVAMTFPSLGRIDTHVVGDSGDSLLVMWFLGWIQHAVPHGWDAVWNTSMFHPTANTLAFSDSMLSVSLAQWPLRLVFGPESSLNLLAIATQTAALWFTYRLAFVLTASARASFVAAPMFGFSVPLLSHLGHYQLMLSAFLVPLTLLLLVRHLRMQRIADGVGVGLTLGVLTTSSTYYALMTGLGVVVLVVGYFAWFRPSAWWPAVRGLLVGAVVALVFALPVAAKYSTLQADPHYRRTFEPANAAHLGDYLSVSWTHYVVDELPVFDDASDRGIENHLYPGAFTFAFALVGVATLARILRGRGPASQRWVARVTLLIGVAGIAGVVLAVGDEIRLLGETVPMPMKLFREYVPGFSGIRVTSRFVLLGQCALALLGAFGVKAMLERVSKRTGLVLVALLCALVLVESARSVPYVDVPDDPAAEGVGRYLRDRPDGVVVELPMRGIVDGPMWAYSEAPRLYVSLLDKKPRLNGYSGYTPPGFEEMVSAANAFPAPAALELLDDRGVRYVVLRTRVVGEHVATFRRELERDGVGRFTPATARARIAEIPEERVERIARVPGAFVVELRAPRRR
jgi:hypothetical protein